MKERNEKYVLLVGFLAELSEAALYTMLLQALISSCSRNLLFFKGSEVASPSCSMHTGQDWQRRVYRVSA
jgi:hypothetical protein